MRGKLLHLTLFLALIFIGWDAYGQTIIYTPDITNPGVRQFTVPAGVTSITVEVWGAGGKGGSRSSGNDAAAGGGGGAYSRSTFTVTPGQVINYYVGFGATSLNKPDADSTWFVNNTTLMARGGKSVQDDGTTGAAGGLASEGFGDFTRSGGRGANKNGSDGGGGGSSAGINGNGNYTGATTTSTGASAPLGGGNGGNGATSPGPGGDGASPGGGGGGAKRQGASQPVQPGGLGGNGQIRISYIRLTSATGTDNQSVCVTTPITTTTYTVPILPSSSTVSITGLPAGLTSDYNSSTETITISGTPTASGTYTITVTPSYFSSVPITLTRTGSVTVIPNNTVTSSAPNQTRCINTALSPITHTTTGATGIANNGVSGANGLPPGVSASWASNTITISGTPTTAGTYNYSILLTGGCGAINATGTITVNPNNTASVPSSTPTLCINTTLGTNITHTTTGATGISNSGVSGANGLPTGMSATWSANTITISGTPTVSGTFNYSIPLTGGCGAINAIGTITVAPNNTASAPSSTPTLCINTPLTNITHTTTGATGIGAATGLPAGVTANWSGNTITISGTPTVSGTFNYSIPLTGGCNTPAVNATGTITVTPNNTVSSASSSPTLCINTPLTNITHTTTGSSGISNAGISGANGLPMGLSASWSAGVITISGTPTQSGTFNYSIPTTGGCLALAATGTIIVNPATAITAQNMSDQRICDGASFTTLSVTATGVGTLSYQWFSNDSPTKTGAIPVGTNSNSFTPPSGTIGTKYYYVEVTSGCSPIATSNFSQATVEPITSITTQPSTANDVECFGDGFDPLTVVANGADLTYQWYSNTTQTNSGGTLIPGATSNSFTPPSTDIGSILYYYVVVTGYCTSQTSTVSGFHRVNPPKTVIDINPDSNSYTVCKGDSFAELNVLASGEGTITYQWYSNTSPQNTGGTLIPGETSSTFTPPSNVVGTLYYYATGKSNCGTVPTAVSGAYTVTAPTEILSQNLAPQTICFGSSFTPVSITAKGTGPVSYQWYTNTTNSNSGGTPISGATSSTYTPPSSAVGTNYYYVVASSSCGPDQTSSASGAFVVNPLPTPTFTTEPLAPVCVGESATYTTQPGQSNYVWSGFGTAGTDFTITSGGIGSSSNSVTVTWLTSGTKNISVSYTDPNGCTAVTSATNSLTVNPLPIPTFTAAPSAPICAGSSVTYTTQSGQSNYIWSVPGVAGTDYTITSGGIGPSSNTVTLTWLTSGSKNVTVGYTNSNNCSSITPASNTLTVNPLPIPTFTTSPSTQVCEQQSITYETQSGKSNYVWNVPGTLGTDYIITSGGFGSTNSTATIQWLTGGSKTVTVRYTEPSTGCVATTTATSTTQVQPYATVGLPVAAVGQEPFPTANFPSVCISSPSIRPFVQPTTGVTGIGTPTGLPAGINVVFNSSTGNIEFSGNVTGVTPGLYSYSISLIGNCINGQNATGTIDVTPTYELTSVSAVSATVAGGSATVIIKGNPSSLPNGQYVVEYILDDGTPPPDQPTSAPFIVSNGTGSFPTIPLTDINVDVYKISIKSIRKVTDVCTIPLNQNDPKNYAFFSVCGATFDINGTFTVPAGIYEITIQARGAGAAGQTTIRTIPVTPGEPLGVVIGQGAGSGSARDSYVTRDSSLPNPQTTGLAYAAGGGSNTQNGSIIISYSCPDPNKEDCIEIIDDGAKSGTTVIRFTCDYLWPIPEGLVGFSVYAVGGGGGGGMSGGNSGTAGGGGAGGFISTTISSSNPYGIPSGNNLNITVGDGGPGATNVDERGFSGNNTTVNSAINDPYGNISININAQGGGGGASFNNINGANGASGGGGAYSNTTQGLGGSGVSGQGRNGGNSVVSSGTGAARSGGGGGGVGSVGGLGKAAGSGSTEGGAGGSGLSFSLSGLSYGYGAGGGGVGYNQNGNSSPGLGGAVNGTIIGGNGNLSGQGNPGLIYTGSGGGAGTTRGGKGGSGVVYVSFLNVRILEVEFQKFEASYNSSKRSGDLTWTTAKEWDNSHFEIERSVNGIKGWTKVGQVAGSGYSDAPVSYSFSDKTLPAAGGNIFYRLKQVDHSGKFSYSVTRAIQVEPIKGATAWVVYPNPTDGKNFQIEMISSEEVLVGEVNAMITTSTGQTQFFADSDLNRLSKNIGTYLQPKAAGVYVVSLSWNGKSESFRIIKQ
ncbi:glycine-rich domain-containing protein [Algoriphagus mannitolivorans]|uniref:glycine-rich domain-containing protein n=1 Tax=Algoriphagus mannitolivorans TaxID=226504 RepID=UPI000423BB70|nr:T9SS type A sorting domain-containing protein [Algoriphagus mannitolivorans]